MFNMAGEVLGIVSHFISKSGGVEGLGFAVAANVARELVLERGAPWHGIDGLFLSDDLVRILNVPGPGVLVQRIVPDSTGARLGLRGGFVKATIGERTIILGGDVILKAQGVPSVRGTAFGSSCGGSAPGTRCRSRSCAKAASMNFRRCSRDHERLGFRRHRFMSLRKR
jgi:S1-C subfamily serine protease